MKNLSRLFLATTLGAVLLGFASPPLKAAGRVGGSAFDGSWSVQSTLYVGTAVLFVRR